MVDEHKIPLGKLYGQLRCSPEGLTSAEAGKRLSQYGRNVFIAKKRFTLLLQFLNQFTNLFAILLFIGAALAFVADSFFPGQGYNYIAWALIAVVILNAIFTFFQKYRSEKIMQKFREMLPPKMEILRDGKRQEVVASLIVPGDIMFLSEGDKVPADARLIEENVLKVDHSSITGESEPQLRTLECTHDSILETRNVVLSGTLVQSGNGKALVYATGNNTQIGKIATLTRETDFINTPLHREIAQFVRHITLIAVSLGVLFFILGKVIAGETLLESLIFAIGIIVANVPEGLLPTVTLSLSIAAKRMAKKNALVRDLESIETIGATTVICTDKTGTLTQNKMAVTSIFVNLQELATMERGLPRDEAFLLLLRSMVLCNNSHSDPSKKKQVGDPTETSLLEYAQKWVSPETLFAKEKRLHELPFDSKTKRMITLNKSGAAKIAFMKGAPEVALRMCRGVLVNGRVQAMNKKLMEEIEFTHHKLASRGERVLAFAYKESSEDITEDKFIFLGLVGMIDPPRPEVPDAIAKCESAGIRVIMITGDHSLTAEALARKIGLIKGKTATVVTGEQLEHMDEAKLKVLLKKDNLLFARTTPLEKLRIVKCLQDMGEVVTVTGDGVNDAPALKEADMGVAMGASGTEVAREARDMILMDDNFATIVNAVEEGRTIFDNIKKFITYILTSNMAEIVPFIIFALFNVPLALTVVLILCIDLGTDMLPAIGLGSEKAEEDVMKLKPRSRKEELLTRAMLLRGYVYFGLLQAAAGFFAFFVVLFQGGWQWGQVLPVTDMLYMKAVTAYFAAVVVCQVGNLFICRARREPLYKIGFFSNKLAWLGIGVEILLLLLIVYFPYAHSFFGTQPLAWWELLLGIPFAILMVFLDGMRKFFLRRKFKWVEKNLSW